MYSSLSTDPFVLIDLMGSLLTPIGSLVIPFVSL